MSQREGSLKKSSFLRRTEFSMIVIIAVIFVVCAAGTEMFMSEYNLTNLLKQCSIIGVISISMTFIKPRTIVIVPSVAINGGTLNSCIITPL